MERTYNILKFNTKLLAYLALIGILLYVVSGRVLLAFLPDYRDDLETYLSEELEVPVEIEQLATKWSGFDPILELRGISVNGAHHAHVKTAQLKFAFLNSLVDRAPRIKSILLDTTNLSLRQSAGGGWWLAGVDLGNVKLDDEPQEESIAIEDVLDGASLRLVDVFVRVNAYNEEEKLWRLPSSSVSYIDGRMFAQGNLIRPDGLQPLLRFVYNSSEISASDKLEGELFIEARSASFLDKIIQTYSWQGVSLQELDASGRLWLDLHGLKVESLFAQVQIHKLNWNSFQHSLAPINKSTVSVSWNGNEHGQRIDLYNLDLSWKGRRCKVPGASVDLIGSKTEVAVSEIDLRCLSDFLLTLGLVEGRLAERIEVGSPRGILRNIWFSLDESPSQQGDVAQQVGLVSDSKPLITQTQAQPDGVEVSDVADNTLVDPASSDSVPSNDIDKPAHEKAHFELALELDQVALNAFDGAPGVKGVDGYLQTDQSQGAIHFDSDTFELFFPDLYLKSWKPKNSSGTIGWRAEAQDFTVESEGLSLVFADDSKVFGDFVLRLNDDEHEDYLGLMLGMRNIAADNVEDFVPFYIVDKELYDWLSQSLDDGIVSEGMYFGYGNVESNSPDNSFTSSLALRTDDVTLSFDDQWPSLTKLNAELNLHEDRLEIEAQDAAIDEADVASLYAYMPGTSDEDPIPRLDIDADIKLDNEDYEYWMGESPIAGDVEALNTLLSFSGESDLNLNLALGLDDELSTHFVIDLDAKDVRVKHRDSHLEATQLKGKIVIDSSLAGAGLNAESVSMNLLGNQTVLSIASDTLPEGQDVTTDEMSLGTNLSLIGKAQVQELFKGLEWDYGLQGQFDYRADLRIPNDEKVASDLLIQSDLVGVESRWPAPLSKYDSLHLNTLVKASFKNKQTNLSLSVKGGGFPNTSGEFLFIDDTLEFGQVTLNSLGDKTNTRPYHYVGDGVGIAFFIDEFEVAPWVDFVQKELIADEDQQDADAWGALSEIRVQTEQMDLYDNFIDDVAATLQPDSDRVKITLDGEGVKGEVLLPDSQNSLDLELERLTVRSKSFLLGDNDKADEIQESALDPRDLPLMRVVVDQLTYDNKDWGSWNFWTEEDDLGLIFRDLSGRAHGSDFVGQMTWHFDPLAGQLGQHSTILTLDANGTNIEPVLDIFGQASPLTSSKYKAELALVWPDQPQNFSLAAISGSALLNFEQGTIRTDDNATGVLRLFGIFSLDALSRRLRLDFSDIYESGISYDDVYLNAVIDQGNMRLVDPLTINGPSSNYVLRGGVDLEEETLDLKMLVELPLSSNVPLAGLVLGNPAVGGAVWLVDKILGEPLSKLTTLRYALTGSWNDPKVELEKALNAK